MKLKRVRTQDQILELGSKQGFSTEKDTGLTRVDAIEVHGEVLTLKARGMVVVYPWQRTLGGLVDEEAAAEEAVVSLAKRIAEPGAAPEIVGMSLEPAAADVAVAAVTQVVAEAQKPGQKYGRRGRVAK